MAKFTLPKKLKKVETEKTRVVLAHGEVTGHAHAIYDTDAVELLESTDVAETQTFLKVKKTTSLKHEEHTAHTLTPGIAKVVLQKQYAMGQILRAAD